jgi:hypothetical protein
MFYVAQTRLSAALHRQPIQGTERPTDRGKSVVFHVRYLQARDLLLERMGCENRPPALSRPPYRRPVRKVSGCSGARGAWVPVASQRTPERRGAAAGSERDADQG